MRLVTRNAVTAFESKGNGEFGNTIVQTVDGITSMFLFGNKIAELDENYNLKISNAGWKSNTTKERLNGLNGVSIQQKKGVWYLNGNEWNGTWVRVN